MPIEREKIDALQKVYHKPLDKLLIFPGLSIILQDNPLFVAYYSKSFPTINRFLLGDSPQIDYPRSKIKIDNPSFTNPDDKKRYEEHIKRIRQKVSSGQIANANVDYAPITPDYIRSLIEMDEVFRLSKYWNLKEHQLYRGTVEPIAMNMDILNSWSKQDDVAKFFQTGCILSTQLPARFPAIDMIGSGEKIFTNEEELLLPPCDFEIYKNDFYSGDSLIDRHEVHLRPRSLAAVMLEHMKNPPAEYPKLFLTDPFFGYAEALKMLETYVHDYVDKKIINVGGTIIKELPDPEIAFTFDDEKN